MFCRLRLYYFLRKHNTDLNFMRVCFSLSVSTNLNKSDAHKGSVKTLVLFCNATIVALSVEVVCLYRIPYSENTKT